MTLQKRITLKTSEESGFIIICFNTHKRGFVVHNLKIRQTGSITGLFKQISLLIH